jgi:transcriptional regulator with XRE-family HTH domain
MLSPMDNNERTGLDLKVERTRRRVKATALALAMGVSKSRVSAIEREQFPSDEIVSRYRAALDTCAPSPTSEAA